MTVVRRRSLSTVEPEGCGGVIDGDAPLREVCGTSRDRLEAGVDTRACSGLEEGAGLCEGRLGHRMILSTELKDNVITLLSSDLGRVECKSTITNEHSDIGSGYEAYGGGSNHNEGLEELHFG